MIIFGYAIETRTSDEGVLEIKTRVPLIHGPYDLLEYKGRPTHGYIADSKLPWYQSVVLPKDPQKGDVVALTPLDDGKADFLIVGLMGSSYHK